MSDPRFGRSDDGERLPWLEPVEEEAEVPEPGMGKAILLVVLGLVLLGAVVGGYSWWSQDRTTEGHGELIAAPAGPYKVAPADPGGMEVEGEGDTAFAASEGAEPRGSIDVGAVAEAPVTRPAPGAKPAAAKPDADGTIQLGAFSSEGAAQAAWKALSTRFAYLAPLSHAVLKVENDDKTLYRLRASGPGAAALCGRLQVAGETCLSVN